MDNNSEDPISLDIQDLLNKIIVKIESDYLIIKNRQQCQTILLKEKIDSTDLIDAFVSLHLIMEVGLNGLFRQLSLRGIKKGVSEI